MSFNSFATITAHPRNTVTKGDNHKLLKDDMVIGVMYGKSIANPMKIYVNKQPLMKLLDEPSIKTRILTVDLEGKNYHVIIKDVQFDSIKDEAVHFDFLAVEQNDVVTVSVPVRAVNKENCPGIRSGGDVTIMNYIIKLQTPADAIPHAIDVDVGNANIGDAFYMSDCKFDSRIIKPKTNMILVKITGKKVASNNSESTAEAKK